MFDSGMMAHDRLRPDRDWLTVARLAGITQRHALRGNMTEAETIAAAAELREVAADRADLLAEVAGIALGTAESRGEGYEARAQAVAELCRMAGADESLIPQWVVEGRRRAKAARIPPPLHR
jgi:hypothetical protein